MKIQISGSIYKILLEHSHSVFTYCICFSSTRELCSCDRGGQALKSENIHCLFLHGKSFLTADLRGFEGGEKKWY